MSIQKTGRLTPRYQGKALKVASLSISFFALILGHGLAQEEVSISSVTASSAAVGYPATKAIDQNLSTFWQGANKKKIWFLRLDLGKPSSLNKLSIYWHKDSGSTNYSLQGSNNARTWINLLTNLSSSGGLTNPHLKEHNLSGSYRYLRLYIRKAQKSYPIVYELKVFAQAQAETISPTGSIKINNDQAYTNLTSVTLNLSAQDNPGGSGISQMQLSNDGINWSAPEVYAITKTWRLTSGDGQKSVFVKFKDVVGNWSPAFSDTITLDTTAPQIMNFIPKDSETLSENTYILITASFKDPDPSPLEYQFSIDGIILQPWLPPVIYNPVEDSYSGTYNWLTFPGAHILKIEVRDIGGQQARQNEIYVFREPVSPPE